LATGNERWQITADVRRGVAGASVIIPSAAYRRSSTALFKACAAAGGKQTESPTMADVLHDVLHSVSMATDVTPER